MHRSQLAQAALDRFDASLDFGKIHVQPVGFPHVQAGGLAPRLLLPAKLGAEKLIQRLLLPFRSESQWLAALQVAHHRHKLLLLPQVDLVHPQANQGGSDTQKNASKIIDRKYYSRIMQG